MPEHREEAAVGAALYAAVSSGALSCLNDATSLVRKTVSTDKTK
jgi:hypothetical protein